MNRFALLYMDDDIEENKGCGEAKKEEIKEKGTRQWDKEKPFAKRIWNIDGEIATTRPPFIHKYPLHSIPIKRSFKQSPLGPIEKVKYYPPRSPPYSPFDDPLPSLKLEALDVPASSEKAEAEAEAIKMPPLFIMENDIPSNLFEDTKPIHLSDLYVEK